MTGTSTAQRPSPDESAPFYHGYIARVPDGCVLEHLRRQGERTASLLASLDEARGAHRYADGKWTVKRLVQHVVDGERLFCCRALCIARGETGPLPGFDENVYAAHDGTDARRLADVAAEYASVRAATRTLFAGFDIAAWQRRGVANGKPVGVRALAWITVGHELHHLAVLRERYGVG
jgi:hypothetical protein